VIWPFPYVYTGGVNPLLWRPITAIDTLDIPAYHVDLTPFAGLLDGTHTMTVTVVGNSGYWLAGGSLFLYEDHGVPTSGTLLKDTLTFPTVPTVHTMTALGNSQNTLMDVSAFQTYEIEGSIQAGGQSWTSDVTGTLTFFNDQTNVMPDYWQLVHGTQDATMTDTVTGPGGSVSRSVTRDYTIDAASAFLQPAGNTSSFFLPADVTQTLDINRQVSVNQGVAYSGALHVSVQGYAALEEDGASSPITKGATTGYLTYQNSRGQTYRELLMARGGELFVDRVNDGLTPVPPHPEPPPGPRPD
jgi:hypothetical protein